MNQQHKELPEQFARLMDSVNRLMLFAAILTVYFFITPILYRIEKATTTTATQLEKVNEHIEIERAIKAKMKDPKQWEANKHLMIPNS